MHLNIVERNIFFIKSRQQIFESPSDLRSFCSVARSWSDLESQGKLNAELYRNATGHARTLMLKIYAILDHVS